MFARTKGLIFLFQFFFFFFVPNLNALIDIGALYCRVYLTEQADATFKQRPLANHLVLSFFHFRYYFSQLDCQMMNRSVRPSVRPSGDEVVNEAKMEEERAASNVCILS